MLYFAYGSNLWRPRLERRVGRLPPPKVGRLRDYALRWHKRSEDGSGKCNIVASTGDVTYGALYQLSSRQMEILDAIEGVGAGYLRDDTLGIDCDESVVTAAAYVAETTYIDERLQPYAWYRDLVIAGANDLGFPASYIDRLQQQAYDVDADVDRDQAARDILNATV